MSQSPQTGQVYFNHVKWVFPAQEPLKSQSPQTGQVYFNCCNERYEKSGGGSLNPLKRVKFISI